MGPYETSRVERRLAFGKPTAKLTIGSLDESHITVVAQYNPKEIKIDQPVTWHEHKSSGADQTDGMTVEFGGMLPQTMTLELFFDGFERGGRADEQTVSEKVRALKQLASVVDPNSNDPLERAPHFCVVTWGATGELPPLRCVIASMATTYQMFSSDGVVLRATVSLQLKEANRVLAYRSTNAA